MLLTQSITVQPITPSDASLRTAHPEFESTTYRAIACSTVSTDHRHKNNSKDQAHPRITIPWCPSRALAGPLGRASRAAHKIIITEGETS